MDAAEAELDNAAVADMPEVALADAGYLHQKPMESAAAAA